MATSTVMQTFLARPATRVTTRAKVSHLFPVRSVQHLRRNATILVRCMAAEEDKSNQPMEPKVPDSVTTPPKPQPTPVPKVSTKFSDVLAFSGPAPERINGRLAMIGFAAAMAMEVLNGQDVFSQLSNGGVEWFLGTSLVVSLASLIPLFNGVTVESKSDGLMTSDAELWNGRFAMLGLVALAFTEYVKGGALV